MHQSHEGMDRNKMNSILKAEDFTANVRIANHHPVHTGQVWDRSIPDPQLLCVLAGSFEYLEAGKPAVRLEPEDILFIEPNIPHRFQVMPGCEDGWITGMHFEFTPTGAWTAGDYQLAVQPRQVIRVEDPHYIQDRFKRLAAVYESYHPFRRELTNAIATEILLYLAAYWDVGTERVVRPSQRMETILAYIRENLSAPLTRQSLAETFNLSAGYINQLFKVELGMSPTAVINRERATRAYQLINHEGKTVAEAALAVGFQDPFYFSRVFKQIYAIPPSQVAVKR
jgi:AraC-like DNA-binding protein